jgi:hypothetical protein
MSRTLERRLRRLEQEADVTDGGELIEQEYSDETKDIMREALGTLGRLSPEDIEAQVNKKILVARHLELGPEAMAILDESRARLRQQRAPTA